MSVPTPETPAAAPQEEAADDSHMEAPSTVDGEANADAGEEQMFSEKAVLYRYDGKAGEWKERGQGFMKILKNTESGKFRVLMRRAQTFRVCANHFILPQMELKPHAGSDRALIWNAIDFADGEESHDTLTVKFKNAEICGKFKEAFDNGKTANAAILEKIQAEKKE